MIYLAGPYTHPDEAVRLKRYEALTAKAAELMKDGHVVFSPITHGHVIAEAHDLPTDFAWWGKQCLGMLRHADKIMVLALPGHEESKGVGAEIRYAETMGISIEYIFTID